MKKITFLFLMSLISISSFAQLANESFDGAWPPPGWGIYNNGSGTEFTWAQSPLNSAVYPPHTGTHAAFAEQENVLSGVNEDWLVTPALTVPAHPKLRFWSRLTQNGNQGTTYQVRVSSIVTPGSQGTFANYTTVLATWTETQINPTQREYIEKTVTLPPEMVNTRVHIALVMIGANGGDRWLVDDVMVYEQCLDPENIRANNPGLTTAELMWDNPSGATTWEVEVIPADADPTRTGVTYSGALPYRPVLLPDTDYKYYVRAVCDANRKSQWVGPLYFSTVSLGATCGAPIVIDRMPFTTTDNTADYGDDYEGSPGNVGCGTSDYYLDGYDVVYSYTPTVNQVISLNMSGLTTDGQTGVFIYTSCDDIGVSCFAGATTGFPVEDFGVEQLSVSAGTTYYIVVASSYPETVDYTMNIQVENCAKPTNLVARGATTSSIILDWDENGSATSWEYKLQAVGTGLPTTPGVAVTTDQATVSPLPSSTGYEYYVRSNCGNGTFSSWAGPVRFNTLCETLQLPFSEGFNTGSLTQFCWTVLNTNNDDDAWDMDYIYNAYEGDQAAVLYTDYNDGDNDDWLISPTINLTGEQRLRYRYRVESQSEPNDIEVLLSTTGIDPANFTVQLVPLESSSNTEYSEVVVNLVNTSNVAYTGPVNIAWHVPAGGLDGWRVYIDDVVIEPIPSCPEPTRLNAEDFTTTSAKLSWNRGFRETSWQVVVQPQGTGVPAATAGGTPITQNPYTATSLLPSTQYEYYVRAYCAANDQSQWVGPYRFTTLCAALPVPFFEGFDSNSSTEFCWTVLNANNDDDQWDMNIDYEQYEGDQAATIYTDYNDGDNDDWLISPTLNMLPNHRLKFRYKIQSETEPNNFEVLLSTTGLDPAGFTNVIVPLTTYSNTGYVESITNLNGYTGPVNIAWHVPAGGPDGWRIMIDNVVVEPIPSCPEPTNIEVSCLSPTGANFNWTAGGTETSWEVAVVPGGSPAPTTPGDVVNEPVFYVDDLNPVTDYVFYIRAVCPGVNGQFGAWVRTMFTTPSTSVINATGFCASVDSSIVFNNTYGDSMDVYGEVACLGSTPNPVWYYLEVDTSGNLDFSLIQNTAFDANGNPVGVGLDVDFVAFGPFTSLNQACANIALEDCPTCPNNTSDPTYYPFGNIIDCSFDSAYVEAFTIPNAVAGEIYAVLITNYSREQGQIRLEQLASSTGTTNCDIIYDVTLGEDKSVCGVTETTITATVTTPGNSGIPTYQWYKDGALFTPVVVTTTNLSQTIRVTGNTTTNDYSVIVTVPDATNTEPITDVVTVKFGPEVIAANEYEYTLCDDAVSDGYTQFNLTSITQEVLGTLQASNYTAVFFRTETAAIANRNSIINPASFTNTVANGQIIFARVQSIQYPGCFDIVPVQLTVKPSPETTMPANYSTCAGEPVTLTGTPVNYTIADADFVWFFNGTAINNQTSNTITVSDAGTYMLQITVEDCINTVTTQVKVNPIPEFTLPTDAVICNGTPEPITITPVNFAVGDATYTWSLNGTIVGTDSTIEVTQSGIYEIIVDIEGCIKVDDVAVTIGTSPTIDAPLNEAKCDTYILPALTSGNYYTGSGGTGTALTTGTEIKTTQLIYVYAESAEGCASENSFTVTITPTPKIVISEGCDGNDYVLEVLFEDEYNQDNVTFAWSDSTGRTIGTNAPTLTINAKGTYSVTVTPDDAPDCAKTDEIVVDDTSCQIQKGISPNGDTKNDSFDLSALGVSQLGIFNRYGAEVFTYGNYTDQWHGQGNNGDELPTGTYYYMVKRDNGETTTGWVYINREEK